MRVGATVLAALILTATRSVAQVPCDTQLTAISGDLGYRQRGNLCEGGYMRLVGGTTQVRVESFMASTAVVKTLNSPLTVSWSGPPAETVALRIEALGGAPDYRLDYRATGPGSLTWPPLVATGLGVTFEDLGFTASLPGKSPPVYTAVQIDRDSIVGYQVVVVPQRLFKVLSYQVVSLATGRDVMPVTELGLGYYPAEQPVPISLPVLAPGMYEMRLAAGLDQMSMNTFTVQLRVAPVRRP